MRGYPLHLISLARLTPHSAASPQGEAYARRQWIINNGSALNQRLHRVEGSPCAFIDRVSHKSAGFRPCAHPVGFGRDAKALYAIACIEGVLRGRSIKILRVLYTASPPKRAFLSGSAGDASFITREKRVPARHERKQIYGRKEKRISNQPLFPCYSCFFSGIYSTISLNWQSSASHRRMTVPNFKVSRSLLR